MTILELCVDGSARSGNFSGEIIENKNNEGFTLNNLADMLAELDLENNIALEDIPGIDLYMDQIIQLFEKNFGSSTRNEDEKVLTKTMINNYAKGKLFFPIKNKKYSKEHLILISLIYQLKGGLSIQDIKQTLHGINKRAESAEFPLDQFYQSHLNLHQKNIEIFNEDVLKTEQEVKEEVKKLDADDPEELETVLLIASLINISNFYRRTAEKLVDQLAYNNNQKG
jgi:DNA-binding transcriptional MerR regulator